LSLALTLKRGGDCHALPAARRPLRYILAIQSDVQFSAEFIEVLSVFPVGRPVPFLCLIQMFQEPHGRGLMRQLDGTHVIRHGDGRDDQKDPHHDQQLDE
jgi:hypothetical protein